MRPVVSREAQADLDAIAAWISTQWSPRAAADTIEAILERVEALADLPLVGTSQPEFGDHVRYVLSGRYVIYYEATDAGLTVLRILHHARDRDAIMRGVQEEPEAFAA